MARCVDSDVDEALAASRPPGARHQIIPTTIDFSLFESIAVATAVDSSLFESIAVAAAIDF